MQKLTYVYGFSEIYVIKKAMMSQKLYDIITLRCAVILFLLSVCSKAPLEETVSELRKELEQCLISNKAKREQVHRLETELSASKDQVKDQEMKTQRMEKIAQEHEVKFVRE